MSANAAPRINRQCKNPRRAYVLVKDARTGKSVGFTVDGLTRDEAVAVIEKAFANQADTDKQAA
jgi:hypothetical protein